MAALKNYNFPDPLAPFEEKITNEYGLKIAKLISSDWFDSNGFARGACEYLNRREYVRNKRLFVRGEQRVKELKEAYSPRDGALELVNLDFTPINWAEKFNRVVSGGISDENYTLDIRATDRLSVMQKISKRDELTKFMVSKNLINKAQKMGLPTPTPKGYVPEDEEELDVHMEIAERPKIEIAEEMLINYVLKTNDWDYWSKEYNKELVDVGLIVCRVYLDKNDGVKFSYVDSEFYVHSKVAKNNFSDKKYEGVVEVVTISDIRRESNFGETELRKIAKVHNSSNTRINWDTCPFSDIIDQKVEVLRFAYKTSKKIVYKKSDRKGETIKMSRRSTDWEGSDKKKVEKILDTWLEGTYILGSEYIYDYKECENLYDDVMNKAMSPFITFAHKIYENRLQSFSTNIEAPARMLQRISNKIQHLVNELKPDGVAIDLDMLAELDDGKGGSKREAWETTLNIYEVKGVVFTKRVDTGDMGIKDKGAVTPMAYEQGTALVKLLNAWVRYYDFIRELTGVNPAMDGTQGQDALVGVSELARLSGNTVTRDIVDISVAFKKKICEVISSRIKSIFKYKEATHLKEIYLNVVGKQFLDAVELMKDRHLNEFGFTYEMYPTVKALQEFNSDLAIAISDGSIDVQVKAEANMIARSNLKMATQYVMIQRKRTMKRKHELQMAEDRNKSEGDAMAAQAASQAKVQAYSAEAEIDVTKAAKLSQIKLAEAQAMQQIQAPVLDKEFQEEVYLTKIKEAADWGKKDFLENRKDDRTAIQASQQSQLKKQSQTDGEPIDFESPDNWMMEGM